MTKKDKKFTKKQIQEIKEAGFINKYDVWNYVKNLIGKTILGLLMMSLGIFMFYHLEGMTAENELARIIFGMTIGFLSYGLILGGLVTIVIGLIGYKDIDREKKETML